MLQDFQVPIAGRTSQNRAPYLPHVRQERLIETYFGKRCLTGEPANLIVILV